MNARMLKILKHLAAYSLPAIAFFITSVPVAQAEALFLFRSPDVVAFNSREIPRSIQQKTFLKLDEKGDLLIQCGNARFTIAYNAPADQLKLSGQPFSQQREYNAPITGISLTASLPF